MNNRVKNYEKSMIISTLCTLILGLLLALKPETSIKIITISIAVILIIIGSFMLGVYFKTEKQMRMVSVSLVISIVLFAISLFLILNTESLANFITIILGMFISIKALFKIQFAINLKNLSEKWKYNLIVGLLSLTLGVLILLNPFKSATLFFRIIGIILTMGSLIELIETILVLKNLKEKDNVIDAKFEEKSKNYEE